MKLKYYFNPYMKIPKIMWLFTLAFFIMIAISGVASAFSDNFDDGTLAPFTVTGAASCSVVTADLRCTAVAPDYVSASIGSGQRYITFKYNSTSAAAGNTDIYWSVPGNLGLRFAHASGIVSGLGFTYSATFPQPTGHSAGINLNWTILAEINTAGNQIRMRIYWADNGTLVTASDQTVSYTYVESDEFRISGAQINWIIDDVVTSGAAPATETSISWDSDIYTQDDTATLSWSLSNNDWSSWRRYFFRVYINDILQNVGWSTYCLCWTQFDIGQQSGSWSLRANEAGSYRVELSYGLITYTIVDEDTTRINGYSTAYLTANASYPYKTQVPIGYSFGHGNINLDYAIQLYYYNKDKGIYEFERSFFGLSSSGTRTIYFEKVGTYVIKLRNVRTDKTYVQTTTDATFAIPETSLNITNSTLNIDQPSYAYGEGLMGNYTIDNTNWTAGVVYLDLYNYNLRSTTEFYGSGVSWTGVQEQVGLIYISLLNSPASENFPPVDIFPGNSALRLMVKNATGTPTRITFINFTITALTDTGYGLQLSKYEVLEGEQFFAYATTPEANAKFQVIDPSTNKSYYNIKLKNASTSTIPLILKNSGTYAVFINNPAGDTEIIQNIKVIKSIPGTTPPTSEKSGESIYNNFIDFMLLPIFWGVIIFIGIVGGMSQIPGTSKNSIGFIAFLFANLFAAVGLWAPYTIYILIVAWIGAGIFFYVGRDSSSGSI